MLGGLALHALSGGEHFVSAGAFASGTTSVAPTYPAGIKAGHTLLLCLVYASDMTSLTGLSGWTLVCEYDVDHPEGGVDHRHRMSVYSKDTVSGSESGTLSLSATAGAGSAFMAGSILNYRGIASVAAGYGETYYGTGASSVNGFWAHVSGATSWLAGDVLLWPQAITISSLNYSNVSLYHESGGGEPDASLRTTRVRVFNTANVGPGLGLLVPEAELAQDCSGYVYLSADASGPIPVSYIWGGGYLVRLRPS